MSLQENLNLENIPEVLASIAVVVDDLNDEDEQSTENLDILSEVYSQIEVLIADGNFNVTENVRIKIMQRTLYIIMGS